MRNQRILITIALFMAATAGVLGGCGNSSTSPEPASLGREEAVALAEHLGSYLAGQTPEERVLYLAWSHGKSASRSAAKDDGDDWLWDYDITCYDAAGQVMDWDSADWTEIARMVVQWNQHYRLGVDDGNQDWIWYLAGAGHGSYELGGIDDASAVTTLNGAAVDSSTYHYRFFLSEGAYDWDCAGQSNWSENHQNVRWRNNYAYDDTSAVYPLDGVSTYAVHDRWTSHWHDANGIADESEDVSGTVRIAYNGTRYVPVTVDDRYEFTLDLDTGEILDGNGVRLSKRAPRRG